MRTHLLWKLMTKGERLYKDMKALGDIEEKKQRLDMDMDKEGATLKNGEGSNSWTREANKQGERAHELDWLHLICAYSCACLHCISF